MTDELNIDIEKRVFTVPQGRDRWWFYSRAKEAWIDDRSLTAHDFPLMFVDDTLHALDTWSIEGLDDFTMRFIVFVPKFPRPRETILTVNPPLVWWRRALLVVVCKRFPRWVVRGWMPKGAYRVTNSTTAER